MKNKLLMPFLTIGALVGFALTMQIKTTAPRGQDAISPFIALRDSQVILEQDQLDLKAKVSNLREQVKSAQGILKGNQGGSRDLVEQIEKLKQNVGLEDAIGDGLVITLADATTKEITSESIVHSSDLRDLVNVLWSAEARAVSINEERIVATTSIDSIVNSILVNNTKIFNPFVVKVIGNQSEIKNELASSYELSDIKKRSQNNGLIYNIAESDNLTIAKFTGGFEINTAVISEGQ